MSSITVPRPFRMTLREAQKKAQWLASPASFEQERKQAQRQGQEEAECHRQFRAQPVPAHVYLPLYREITERSEARRQAGIQKRKELLLSSLKPFSFLVKEEQRKEAAKQRELAATAKAKAPKQKATRRIPKSILEPALGDKLQGKGLLPTMLPAAWGCHGVLGVLGLGGQPGWERNSLLWRPGLQATLRAGHGVWGWLCLCRGGALAGVSVRGGLACPRLVLWLLSGHERIGRTSETTKGQLRPVPPPAAPEGSSHAASFQEMGFGKRTRALFIQ